MQGYEGLFPQPAAGAERSRVWKKSRFGKPAAREKRTNIIRSLSCSPTVDFCFKELMKNPRVRRGFIAALLKKEPEEVEETEVLPGEQPGEYEDEKLGILDVLIRFRDGSRMNLEMQMMAYGYWEGEGFCSISAGFIPGS